MTLKTKTKGDARPKGNLKSASPVERKRRGRPLTGDPAVGKDTLLDITRELLRTTPPLEVTRLKVAQAANVDPNLIRYYFGTVDHLISEVVVDTHRRIHQAMVDLMTTEQSLDWIRARIGHMIDLFIENPYQHQLIRQVMYKDKDSQEHKEWVAALRTSLEYTKAQLDLGADQGLLRRVDSRMFHLALIGIGEIFGANPDIVSDIFSGEETVASLRDRYVDFIFNLFYLGLRSK